MSLRSQFKTDKKLESDGIELDYGDAVIDVRRAGGSNRKYRAALAKALKPLRSAIEAGSITEDQLLPVVIPVFVDHVILRWRTRTGGELVPGIEGATPTDPLIPYSPEAAKAFLLESPELYRDLNEQASGRQLFLADLEAAAGN
jgi:hypothetical protein